MTLFNVNDKLKAGEIIVTSGLGGIYLPGIEIGKVKEVKIDNLGLNQTAYIEPLYDLNDLEYVILLFSKNCGCN